MKLYSSCPITFEKIDENIIRLQAGVISILGLLYILNVNYIIISVLLYDFLVRVAGYKKFSFSIVLATFIANKLSLSKNIVDAGPKKFAAKIGLVFMLTVVVLYLLNSIQFSTYIMMILVFCAALESLFSFCLACTVYPIWRKLIYKENK